MPSGDGLLLRVRPPLQGLTVSQVQCLVDLAHMAQRAAADAGLTPPSAAELPLGAQIPALPLARPVTLCAEAGGPVLEISSRAGIQLRGIRPEIHSALLRRLARSGLLDVDARREVLRAQIMDPLLTPAAAAQARRLGRHLLLALLKADGLHGLPAKSGWVIASAATAQDLVRAASLPGDIRLLHVPAGTDICLPGWLLCPDGATHAAHARTLGQAVRTTVVLAQWLARQARASRSVGRHPGRMRSHWALHMPSAAGWPAELVKSLPLGVSIVPVPWQDAIGTAAPAPHLSASLPPWQPTPGWLPGYGLLLGAPLGRIRAEELHWLAQAMRSIRPAPRLHVTPWRMLLLTLAQAPDAQWLRRARLPEVPDALACPRPHVLAIPVDGVPPTETNAARWVTHAQDARLRVWACTGAPGCAQARASTQGLALALVPVVPPGLQLHVSGCAKGCAYPRPAPVTLCATDSGDFALIHYGSARGRPHAYHSPAALLARPELVLAGLDCRTYPDVVRDADACSVPI